MDNHHWSHFSSNGDFGSCCQRRYSDSTYHPHLPLQSLPSFQFCSPLYTSFDDAPSNFKYVTKCSAPYRRPFSQYPYSSSQQQNHCLPVATPARNTGSLIDAKSSYVSNNNSSEETCHSGQSSGVTEQESLNSPIPSQGESSDTDITANNEIESTESVKPQSYPNSINDDEATVSEELESVINSSKEVVSSMENSVSVNMVVTDNSSVSSRNEPAAMESDSGAKADCVSIDTSQQSDVQQECDTSNQTNGMPPEVEEREVVEANAEEVKRLPVPINGFLRSIMKCDLGEILRKSCHESRANHCISSKSSTMHLLTSSNELVNSVKKKGFPNHCVLNSKNLHGNGAERRSPRSSPKQVVILKTNVTKTSESRTASGALNKLRDDNQNDTEKAFASTTAAADDDDDDDDDGVIILKHFVNGDDPNGNERTVLSTSAFATILSNIKTESPEAVSSHGMKEKPAKPSVVMRRTKKRWNHFKGTTYCMAIRPGNKSMRKRENGSSQKKANLDQNSDTPTDTTVDSDALELNDNSNRARTHVNESSSWLNNKVMFPLKPNNKDRLTVAITEHSPRSLSSVISGMSSKLQMALLNGSNKRIVRDVKNRDKEESKVVSSSDLTTNSDVTDIDSVAGDSSDLLNGDIESVENAAVARMVCRKPSTSTAVGTMLPEKRSHVSGKRKRTLRNRDETDSLSTNSDHGVIGAKKLKVVNNLDGMKWPSLLTVPFLQDVDKHRVTTVTVQQLECIMQGYPLCTCKTSEGSYSAENCPEGYCQGIDYIDCRLIGCVNAVCSKEMLRPSVRVPFQALCEVHRQRLRFHQCCPGCGLFCTQGTFVQCRADTKKAIHHCHKECLLYQEGRELCPHCGEGSSLLEVALELNAPRSPAFFQKSQLGVRKEPGARMAFTRGNKYIVSRDSCLNQPSSSCTLKESGKEISSAGLPIGPDRSQLESLLVNISNGQLVNLRYTLKNLHTSAKLGDVEKVLQVLMMGFDPNTKFEEFQSQTLLHVAASHGHLALVHVLVQAGASLDVMDHRLQTPVMGSIENGHTSITQYLIKAGAQLDARGEDGMTSLHLAAREGQLEVCHMILDTGKVNVNICDDGGWTPLVWSAEHRHIDVVQFLLERGSDPNLRDNEQNIALHWSAFSGSLEISEIFLNHGCDLNSINELGDTPLHIAARQDRYEVVMLFLARNAEVHVLNKENETPLMCCSDSSSQTWLALSMTKHLKKFSGNRTTRAEVIVHKDIARGKEQNAIQCVNGVDDEGPPSDFIYIRENCETLPINMDRSIATLQHCDCEDDCSSPKCICGSMSLKCWYDREGRLIDEFNLFDPPMIFECNRSCRCWTTCNNRVVQHGISCRLQLFRTKGKGWGVRALRDIPRGTFICEYVGELISDLDADQRADDSYLFDLDNKDGETYCIDARHYGNIARFINHLCEPNLVPVKIFVDYQDLRFPRIAFFSSRPIRASEELGFDYGDKFWIIKYKMFTCLCGTEKCKYSETTIHDTLANYNQRMLDEQ